MYCKNCGMDSSNPKTCEWCHKPIEAGSGSKKAAPTISAAPTKPAAAPGAPQQAAAKPEIPEEQAPKKKFFDLDNPRDMMIKTGSIAAVGILIIIFFRANTGLYILGLAIALIAGIPFIQNLLKANKE